MDPSNKNGTNKFLYKRPQALNLILNEKPRQFFVQGAPGTGKTAFLALVAVKSARREEKVICYCLDREYKNFMEKIEEARLRDEMSGEGPTFGKHCIATERDILKADEGSLQKKLEKVRIIIVRKKNFKEVYNCISFTTAFRADMIMFDNVNHCCEETFAYHSQNSRVIASFNWSEPHSLEDLDLRDLYMGRGEFTSRECLVLRTSNRPSFFLEWPKQAFYNNYLNGLESTNSQCSVYYYNSEKYKMKKEKKPFTKVKKECLPEAKMVVSIVQDLLLYKQVKAEDIGIGTKHQTQAKLIRELLSNHSNCKVKVRTTSEWQYREPKKHFVFSLGSKCYKNQKTYLSADILVALTRTSQKLHFVGDYRVLELKRDGCDIGLFTNWLLKNARIVEKNSYSFVE